MDRLEMPFIGPSVGLSIHLSLFSSSLRGRSPCIIRWAWHCWDWLEAFLSNEAGNGTWAGGMERGSPKMGHHIGYRARSPYMRQAWDIG